MGGIANSRYQKALVMIPTRERGNESVYEALKRQGCIDPKDLFGLFHHFCRSLDIF